MKQSKRSFRLFYIIYIVILAGLVTAALLYVRSLLKQYEASQPELLAHAAAAQLADSASAGDFWARYGLSDVTPGPFERNRDVQGEYLALYADSLEVSQSASSEDTLVYAVKRDGLLLAEIKLKAAGPTVTKLAVLNIREWTVDSVTPIFAPRDYTLTLPNSFHVQVNGIALTKLDLTADSQYAIRVDGTPNGERLTDYTLTGLYLTPEFVITDPNGTVADYTLKNGRVMVDFVDYSLTLPAELSVQVDGRTVSGAATGDGLVQYDISLLNHPRVCIADDYGNTVEYGGESHLPLTRVSLTADSQYAVRVEGAPVPDHRITTKANPEYAGFAEFVPDLPGISDYRITVLRDNAAVTVTDEFGNEIIPHNGQALRTHALDQVPDEVSEQVDVLRIAQMWSMFLTDDLPFEELEPHLIAGSYQHNVAVKYATGVDIKYTSKHTLFDPAFTENSVTNFTWITENCFSVDISFVKHMRLYYGARVDDPMNDRFYFVRFDDTDNGVDDPAWKLASMKEIV